MPKAKPSSDPHSEAFLTALALGDGGGSTRAKPAARPQGVFYWLPVLVALAVFAQVALLGLRPALRESARLTVAEGLLDRFDSEQQRARDLGRILRAQGDPIYLERERRALLDPDSDLLRR
jgi:hypothetical protein